MKTATFKNNGITTIALLLALPAAYFITSNLLNEIGIAGPYNAIEPIVINPAGKEPIGLNLLILFGPVAAVLLTIFQFVKIEWHFTKEEFLLHFSVEKRWFPIVVTAASLGLLAFIFFYMMVENCNCH